MNVLKSMPFSVSFRAMTEKEVINLCDGSRLGYVCDIEIDPLCARVISLKIPRARKLFCKADMITVRYDQVERIGEDMILVKLPVKCGGEKAQET